MAGGFEAVDLWKNLDKMSEVSNFTNNTPSAANGHKNIISQLINIVILVHSELLRFKCEEHKMNIMKNNFDQVIIKSS